MSDDELMSIGRFAKICGLSVPALRHYADVGLLLPAEVDPSSGYRRYNAEQVQLARLISALRWMDLPIEEIRQVLAGTTNETDVLENHRGRLRRQRALLDQQLGDVTHQLDNGITMPQVQLGCRPVQIKLIVRDAEETESFLEVVFGMTPEVTRRTSEVDFTGYAFGTYGQPDFFLLHLVEDAQNTGEPGPSTLGMLVDDLDAVHSRALANGAVELLAPVQPEGMPRTSAIRDPSGNWFWLSQG